MEDARMVFAVIVAGGSGHRMGQDIPKQFIHINNKPVLIYTLEGFQNHPEIDKIGVVCVEGWESMLQAYARQFDISKLDWVITGGATVQESIWRGIQQLENKCSDSDIVIIHDGIRPMVDETVLTDVIAVAREKGNAVTSMPYNEQVFWVDEAEPDSTVGFIPREKLRRVSTPQAYQYQLLKSVYEKAFETGLGLKGSSYTNTMMVEHGIRLYFAKGSERNVKLTTKEDLDLFKAMLELKRDTWLK